MQQDIRASIEAAGDPATILKQLREELLRGTKILTILLPLSEFSIPGNLWLSKQISVKARLIQYSANMADDIEIEFEPTVTSPLFPIFRGILGVRSANEDGKSILELAGSYEPPMGRIGEAIDAAIGSRIAQRSIENLLSEIALGTIRKKALEFVK